MNILNRKNLQHSNYFDDFFKSDGFAKDYRQILFHPGRVLQTRELVQLQTILNEYSKAHLDTVFKNGSIIQGCYLELIDNVLKVSEGLVYFDGSVYKINELSLDLNGHDDIGAKVDGYFSSLKILVDYHIIKNQNGVGAEQDALLDPAIQYFESEGTVGADRLKITFKLALEINDEFFYTDNDGNVIMEYPFDFENHHWFEYSRTKMSYTSPNFSLDSFDYLNREHKIENLGLEYSDDVENKIVEGLNILHNNHVDININNNSGVTKREISNDISYVNIDKGIGQINGKSIPNSLNTIFKFNKPEKDPGVNTGSQEESHLYHKNKTNENDGVFFKCYRPELFQKNTGNSPFVFDHPNNFEFLDVGRSVAIEKYFTDENKFKPIATANICYVEPQHMTNKNITYPEVWDKHRYQGFWKDDEKHIYIKGMIEDHGAQIYRVPGENRELRLTGGNVNELLRHGTDGGIQAVGQKFNFDGVNVTHFHSEKKDDLQYMSFSVVRFDSSELKTAVTTNKIIPTSMFIYNGQLCYIQNIVDTWDYWEDGDDTADPKTTLTTDTNEVIFILITLSLGLLTTGDLTLQTVHLPENMFYNTLGEYKTNQAFDIIRYHVIDEILPTENGFTIEYNQNEDGLFSSWYDWDSLPTTESEAEDFIIFTSPWEDMCGYENIIRNANLMVMESKFMISKPMLLYFFKYVLFFNGHLRQFVANPLRVLNIVNSEGTTIPNNSTFHKYIYIQPDIDTSLLNMILGDIGIHAPTFNMGIFESVVNIGGTNYLKVLWSDTGALLWEMLVDGEYLSYSNSNELPGSSVENDELFWKISTINTDIIGVQPGGDIEPFFKNNSNYGSATDLQDFYITYSRTRYNRVFLTDIQLETGYEIDEIFNNDNGSTRIVFLNDGELDYNHVIEKGVTIQHTKDIISDHDDGVLNDFNDLSFPFVEDTLNDYSLYTLFNWETKVNDSPSETPNFIIEGDNHLKCTFNTADKILGCYQIYGQTKKEAKAFLKIQGTELPDFESEDSNLKQPHMGNVFFIEYGRNDSEIEVAYQAHHQNTLTPWFGQGSGDLGINIKYFTEPDDGLYVNFLTLNIQSEGMGSLLDRTYTFYNDDYSEKYNLFQGRGLKYYFKVDLATDPLELSSGGGGAPILAEKFSIHPLNDRISNTAKRNPDNPKLINVGALSFPVIHKDTDAGEYWIEIKKNDNPLLNGFISIDGGWTDTKEGVLYYNGASINIINIDDSNDYVKIFISQADWEVITVFTNVEFTPQGDLDDYISLNNINVGFFFAYNKDNGELNIEYFRINRDEVTANSFEVYEYLDDKYKHGFHRLYLISTPPVPSNLSTQPNAILWLPYQNGYSFTLDFYTIISNAPVPSLLVGNQSLLCTVVPVDEIILEDGDPITASLYKEVSKDDSFKGNDINAGIWIKNVEHANSYHPFMRIRENLTDLYGKPLPFNHTHTRRPGDNPELKDVEYLAQVNVDYNFILPDIIHFYLTPKGTVEYMQDISQLFHQIQPVFIPNRLYIGTVPIPPIEPISNTAFLGVGYQRFNLNDNISNYLTHRQSKKEIKTNANMISLKQIYETERRDFHFSTGKKFVYWEKGHGFIRPKCSKQPQFHNINGVVSENVIDIGVWDMIVGINTYFQTTINSGDIIGIYNPENGKTPQDIVEFNPDEIFIVSSIEDNETLRLVNPMRTRFLNKEDNEEGIPGDYNYILPENFIHIGNFSPQNTTENYFFQTEYFIRREQCINFVQYLLNTREYSIFNIIQNKYDGYDEDYTILNLPPNALEFSNDVILKNDSGEDAIEFRRPNINIFDNEMSPHMEWDSSIVEFTPGGEFEEYENDMVTFKPNDNFKIIDTKDVYSGVVDFDNDHDISMVDYGFNLSKPHAKFDTFNTMVENTFILNANDSIKWDLSLSSRFFEFAPTFENNNVMNYDYHVTNKVIPFNNFVKNILKMTVAEEFEGSVLNINLIDKDTTKWSGVSAISLSNIVDHVVEDETVKNYDATITYLDNTFDKFGNALVSNFNGAYQCEVINTNIEIDASNNITNGATPCSLQKISKVIKINDKFNQNSKEYDYIFNQIHNVTHIDSLEITDDINGWNIFTALDTYIKPENWTSVTANPTIYQVYEFKSNFTLTDVKFSLESPGTHINKYNGNILVVFGFMIDGQISPSGIIQTKTVNVDFENVSGGDLSTLGYEWNRNDITMNLDVPIYIPKDKQFFIGFLKNPVGYSMEDCSFKYIENGQYDNESDVQYSYPANLNSYMVLKGVPYYNRMLKIDLGVNQYEKAEHILESDDIILSKPASKIMISSDTVQPDFSFIKYQFKIDNVWRNIELNQTISLPVSQTTFKFRVIAKNDYHQSTPMFKKHITLQTQALIDEVTDLDRVREINYTNLRELCPPFIWKNWSGEEDINYFPIGIKINNMTNRRHLYRQIHGNIKDMIFQGFSQGDLIEPQLPEEDPIWNQQY